MPEIPPTSRIVKTPPLLLGATLVFWGWQSNLFLTGIFMGIILEGARFVHLRWDLAETDFRRIWNFSTLLAFTAAFYALASNEEGGSFTGLFHGAGAFHNATVTTARTATAFLRWLPLIFFLAVAAQVFSVRETMPLTAVSLWLRRQRDREIKAGRKITPVREVNITYAYFIVCIFSAGIHENSGSVSYFWGQSILFAWALWPLRSMRFKLAVWALTFVAVIVVAFFSQLGVRQLHRTIDQYNAAWISRLLRPRTDPLESSTSMGDIGYLKLSGKIVVRLWTKDDQPPPTYLREASYRGYSPRMRLWTVGSPRADFQTIPSETNQTTWILLRYKTNAASATIACYLNGRAQSGNALGLIPLPTGSGRLENLNAYLASKNPEGDVSIEGPGLLIFDALYGPGQTIDAPPETFSAATNLDLLVPTNEMPALDQVISQYKLKAATEQQTLQNVYAFFQRNFSYSLWQGADKLSRSNETVLTRFLLYSRTGHCEYFATATVLLLRELKIPARYAVGYLVHEANGNDSYVVRQRDAHSWCLVWNEKTKAWEDFDTTPGSWISLEAERATFWQHISDFFSWIRFQIAKFRWGQSNVRDYILLALVPVLIFLLYQIIFRHGRRRQQLKREKPDEKFFWPGLDSEFYKLERELAQRGVPRRPGEPLSDWLQRATADKSLDHLREPLQALLRLHYRYRFDPKGLDSTERERLMNEAKDCVKILARR